MRAIPLTMFLVGRILHDRSSLRGAHEAWGLQHRVLETGTLGPRRHEIRSTHLSPYERTVLGRDKGMAVRPVGLLVHLLMLLLTEEKLVGVGVLLPRLLLRPSNGAWTHQGELVGYHAADDNSVAMLRRGVVSCRSTYYKQTNVCKDIHNEHTRVTGRISRRADVVLHHVGNVHILGL